MTKTRAEIEAFLYHENELLDEWKLEEWAALFTDTGSYLIPPLKNPTANPSTSLFYVHDDRKRLEDRAKRLLKKEAHVEYPHSKTLRNISNVRIKSQEGNEIVVRSNFTTYRTKRDVIDTFIGVQDYHLVVENDDIKIQEKKVTLQLDSLRPHGKISLIL